MEARSKASGRRPQGAVARDRHELTRARQFSLHWPGLHQPLPLEPRPAGGVPLLWRITTAHPRLHFYSQMLRERSSDAAFVRRPGEALRAPSGQPRESVLRYSSRYARAPASPAPTHPRIRSAPQVCDFLETHIIPQQPPAAVLVAAAPSQVAPAAGPQQKVLLFAHHRTVMDRLHMFLQGYDVARDGDDLRRVRPAVGHVRIDGSTDHALRAELKQQFKDDPDCTVRPTPL